MNAWIDFKEIRSKLNFEEVLRHYGVEVKRKGNQHHGFCPLPNHEGKRNSPSFSANLERGIFQCFGCGAKGNILDFAVLMERRSIDDGAAFRAVAIQLRNRFFPDCGLAKEPHPAKEKTPIAMEQKTGAPILINAPLDFELKGLDPAHPYLLSRGFTPETIRYFGLGFCSRGYLKDRVAIPLHDQKGQLIGYAGRLVDDIRITAETPKYLFPSKREREGKTFEFRKTRFIYNGFRIKEPVEDLLVVEGFSSVWWLTQLGCPATVAIMGADCSEKQADLIISLVKPGGYVWIIPDGDLAGERCAQSLLSQISPQRFARWIKLPKDEQPTDYPSSFFSERIGIV